ncbi:MAG: hypothetical protein PHO03_00850 [Candidatus Omnitrophica bacterium]|nr:hypothetical protein [Candidatus Omnitrophota bacterium]
MYREREAKLSKKAVARSTTLLYLNYVNQEVEYELRKMRVRSKEEKEESQEKVVFRPGTVL